MATVSIPLLFRDLSGGTRKVEVDGESLRAVVLALDALYPGIAARIHNDQGFVGSVMVVVDGRIATDGLATPVHRDSEVNILPVFGGG